MSGRVITFYSYKGGTGRSLLLANVGWILASTGKRVLMIDWDLEAPGLHRYFHPFLADSDMASTTGVIDWLLDYRETASALISNDSPLPEETLRGLANPCNHAVSMNVDRWGLQGFGELQFIPAGRQDAGYAERVNRFDFVQLFEKLGGARFFESLREQLGAQYDYVLIDSRTGISDTAGICTLSLPTQLVVCFTLNSQSILGASGVAGAAVRQRQPEIDDGSFRVFPVPTRIDRSEKLQLEAAREAARAAFSGFPSHMNRDAQDRYWAQVEIPYESFYSYEEVLAPFGDQPGKLTSMLGAAERIAGYLTQKHLLPLGPMEESTRKEILSLYLRRKDQVMDAARAAENAYLGLQPEEQLIARRLLTRFVYVGPEGEISARPVHRRFLPESGLPLEERFQREGVLSVSQVAVLQLVDSALPSAWTRLNSWILDDMEFLQWRVELDHRIATFERQGRSSDLLLNETELKRALAFQAARGPELTRAEVSFLGECSERANTARVLREERDRTLQLLHAELQEERELRKKDAYEFQALIERLRKDLEQSSDSRVREEMEVQYRQFAQVRGELEERERLLRKQEQTIEDRLALLELEREQMPARSDYVRRWEGLLLAPLEFLTELPQRFIRADSRTRMRFLLALGLWLMAAVVVFYAVQLGPTWYQRLIDLLMGPEPPALLR